MPYVFYDIDQLTGLMNRDAFKKNIVKVMSDFSDKRFVLISIDIDNFKVYNYFFGVEKGDELLQYMGNKIAELGEDLSHANSCRVSGDKFLIFCEYEEEKIDKKIKGFLRSFKNHVPNYTIKPSFGIYVITDMDTPVELMINYAVMAGKQVKGNFKKYIAYYTSGIGGEVAREQDIMNRLDTALKKEEFIIYYQPKYVISTGKPYCSEALVRWKDADGVLHMPDEFIPIYEKNLVISNLDFYVFEQVCRHLRQLLDEGVEPFPVSVNISLINLFNPNFIEILLDKINRYNLDINLVQLEFTESVMFENKELIKLTIDKLHEVGFTILLDDFGKGTASLTMLNELSIDVLKIDKGLLTKDPSSSKNGKILTSLINMAKWMELPVIVEGVETKAQVRFLQNINCEYAQGYYYSVPLPEEEYDMLLKEQNAKKGIVNEKGEIDDGYSREVLFQEITSGVSFEHLAYVALRIAEVQTWIYDHKHKAIYNDNKVGAFWDYGTVLENVPYSMTDTGLVHPDDRDAFIRMFKSIENGELYVEGFFRLKNKDGDQRYYLSHIAYTNIFDEKGTPIKAVGVLLGANVIDDEDELNKNIDVVLLPGTYLLISYNLKTGEIIDIRTTFPELGKEIRNADIKTIRKKVAEFFEFPKKEHAIISKYVDELLEGGKFKNGETVQRINFMKTWKDSDKKQWLVWELYAKEDTNTGEMIGYNVIKDNDIVYREKQRLVKMADSDRMTGLLNHEASVLNIRNYLNTEGRFGTHALIMIDIDNFKTVNDTFGHQVGDEVIINISKRLKHLFKQSDIIGRYGGDEFIVLAKDYKTLDGLRNKAKNMLDKLTYVIEIDGREHTVYCSVGIAVVKCFNINDIELRKRADEELYKVKNSGKHGYSIRED
ncbi:MAG: EAL domain-containing protein [Butyrivibrio sp.]|nr:EAL domain-containing protein [Butyrivibrio sp.]